MDEEWRPVPGLEDRCEASSLGRVRSLPRAYVDSRGHTVHIKGKLRKFHMSTSGYWLITLITPDGPWTRLVHLVIAETFIGPRPEGLQTRHLNGDALDNRAANLKYGTARENALDIYRHGRGRRAPNKVSCPLAHRLIEPNLVPSVSKNGYRACLACKRARELGRLYRRKRDVVLDVDLLAHLNYETLMRRAGHRIEDEGRYLVDMGVSA